MEEFAGLDSTHIHLVSTVEDAAHSLTSLLKEKVLGFDTESRPTFTVGQRSTGPHVLQFTTPRRAFIFQTFQPFCREVVAEVLESRQVVKAGFGLDDDIRRIRAKLRIHPRAVLDLNHTFNGMGCKNAIGAKTAIAFLYGRRLLKSQKITTSNWANRRLSEKQLLYAANDAFAALAVFKALKKKGLLK